MFNSAARLKLQNTIRNATITFLLERTATNIMQNEQKYHYIQQVNYINKYKVSVSIQEFLPGLEKNLDLLRKIKV